MKILFLNTSDRTGGAAIAASRLRQALIKEGVDVSFLVKEKRSNDGNTFSCINTQLDRIISIFFFIWERVVIFLNNKLKRASLFKVSLANTGFDISKHPLVKEADIIHLHWINQGFLSLPSIKKILATGKPVVWTMHDMWICTSICHYSYECTRFNNSCDMCPFLNSTKGNDLSFKTGKKKLFIKESNINLVAVSSWLQSQSEHSFITKGLSCRIIPNVLDNTLFIPSNKLLERKALNFPPDKHIILMGAAKLDDPIKGINYLIDALTILSTNNKKDYLLLLFGMIKGNQSFIDQIPISHMHLGLLNSNQQIAHLYQAADVVVVPSLYETFGQTIIEAMACGCPAVSFNNSGQTDIIDHQVNGYLAEYKSAEDLANGIEWVLNHPNRKELSDACVKKVESCYSESVVARQYIELYNNLLKK